MCIPNTSILKEIDILQNIFPNYFFLFSPQLVKLVYSYDPSKS